MTLQDFERIAARVSYRAKGMFYSEVFIFLQACERQAADIIIESGVKFGMSTKLMSLAWPWPKEIVSIDKDEKAIKAFKSVGHSGGVRICGDSRVLIPGMLKDAGSKRIAVLIDGPKGAAALELKDQCLGMSACCLVGVHDVHSNSGQGETSHSYEPQFAMARSLLDSYVPGSWRLKYPMGPGLGIWEKKL